MKYDHISDKAFQVLCPSPEFSITHIAILQGILSNIKSAENVHREQQSKLEKILVNALKTMNLGKILKVIFSQMVAVDPIDQTENSSLGFVLCV